MSKILHAFKSYKVESFDDIEQVCYENDEGYDISHGSWHYVYTVIQYGNYILGIDVSLPIYDWLDDVDLIKEKGMNLVNPLEFVKICDAVIENIEKLSDGANPLIDADDWYLYDHDCETSVAKQKEYILFYAKRLLDRGKQGLYFVADMD